jgi:hypothetical protein
MSLVMMSWAKIMEKTVCTDVCTIAVSTEQLMWVAKLRLIITIVDKQSVVAFIHGLEDK